ncbi:type II CAAX endopeptidase family protein [Streptococcus agalactiae]|uniref:CPBP family intramembrane glutamic endopeptidase n=1 Tax=Streptococcus agalactiae TaxID=1311 RepID=UPI001374CE25|nr:type II CAAX endopeptidase family protein [Streptococcus agalactiae]KAF1128045.1 CPBP family intramembrane metalloprotease [Streptococcus agalactiae]KAF1246855.1 CPBP family intramembrane metalloprotease [Streptococcus agalactiae]MCD0020633.1 CPBP family intramembrane metalloprotease [Streptococcus agalactiae]HEN0626277.1 CPBP family intramembrane metalloprotease [Streptococcus agalactiae]HEN9895513.1 CPBP family intramembrane metalloprotease [Streptococcus agalactiae]
MNQEKKRLNLIGLILLAQAIVLSLATTLFAEILQNDVWIGIASTLIALLIPCFFMGFKNLKKHLTATHHTITFTTILFLLSIIYTTNNIVSTIWDAVLNHLNIMESESQNYDATFSILMISYSVVVGPFFEEVLYRGIVLNLLSKYGKWFAIITSGILFGLMHQDISQLLTTSIAGIIMGFIAYHYSFKVALLLHICNNFIVEIFTQLSTVNELYGTYFENILLILAILFILYYLFTHRNTAHHRISLHSNVREADSINSKQHTKLLLTSWPFILLVIYDIVLTTIN